jgi:hypothetical protein
MIVAILIIVVTLVAWSLHLMQQAMEQREFSLMLAGTLVAMSAAAMVGVYFLMGDYIGYLSNSGYADHSTYYTIFEEQVVDAATWFSIEGLTQDSIIP